MQGQGGPSCILMDVVQAPVIALSQQTRSIILEDCNTDKRTSNQFLFITMVEATAGVRVMVALDASNDDKNLVSGKFENLNDGALKFIRDNLRDQNLLNVKIVTGNN